MEVLKMKNKSIDVTAFRKKHGLDCEETELQKNSNTPPGRQQYFQILEEVFPEVELPTNVEEDMQADETLNKIVQLKPSRNRREIKVSTATTRATRRTIKTEAILPAPKLLNPTIHPKISNIIRLELFNCDRCSHNCSTKIAMERHMKQIHLKASSTSFKCETCSKSFAKKIILQNHEKIHLTHRPTFACTVCGKALSSQTAVANHMQWFHNEKREFECPSCSKLFATVS